MMADPGWIEFCGTSLWDYNLTWNTTNPDFTDCFQKTVLIWIPCAYLWLLSPLQIYFLLKSGNRFIPWTVLNISKLVISISLMVVILIDMAYKLGRRNSQGAPLPSVDYSAPFILFSTFSLSTALIFMERRRGIQSSGIGFGFWFLLSLCGMVRYRSLLMRVLDEEDYSVDLFNFVLYMIYYPLVIALTFLSCFADAPPAFREIDEQDENPWPEGGASYLSQIWFSWFTGLIWRGYRYPLKRKDLWALNPTDRSKYVVLTLEKNWIHEVQKSNKWQNRAKASFGAQKQEVSITPVKSKDHQPSLVLALFKTFGLSFMYGGFLKLISDILGFVNPILLSMLIEFVSGDEPVWKGYLYASLMFATSMLHSMILGQYYYKIFILSLKMRTAMIAVVYKKSLLLSNSARKASTMGEIINLMSVDAHRFMELIPNLHMVWSSPLQIALALYMLWMILGPSVLAGLVIMILLIPLNGAFANMLKKLQLKQMKTKDGRVKLMNTILSGIKVLKLYAWEPSFEFQVRSIRGKELKVLRTAGYAEAVTSFVWQCAPFLVSLACFTTYVLGDSSNILDPSKAFVSLSVFNIIRMPMSFIPNLIVILVQSAVSLKRLHRFLCHDELNDKDITHDEFDPNPVTLRQASFSWGTGEEPTLKGINLDILEGSLVAVVGPVGCGKSSLISALVGDMDKLGGSVNTKGNIAYVAQQPWIQNASLKDNVLFGNKYDDQLYKKIIQACALKPDLDMLPGGDETEIGEKGINLSGGQKQRVSLARALYSNADLYLLDDPLSAVDSHVGKHIFENVIGSKGMLKNKTRILVTHGITYLPKMDFIVVMNQGQLSELGTYKGLLERKGAFAEFLKSYLRNEEEQVLDIEALEEMKEEILAKIGSPDLERHLSRQLSRSKSETSDGVISVDFSKLPSENCHHLGTSFTEGKPNTGGISNQNTDSKVDTALIKTETIEIGEVKLAVYWYYFKAIGVAIASGTILFLVLAHGFAVATNLWLSAWSSDQPNPDGTQNVALRNLRLGIYGAFGFGQAFFVFLGSLTMAFGSIRASNILHSDMLANILRSPLSFFDTTPLGRILNRFSKDVDIVDTAIPHALKVFIMTLLQVIFTLVVICISTPIFIAVIIPLSVLYFIAQRLYIATSRQLKRLESASRSPIYSHFSETMTGASTIRAYGKQQDFMLQCEQRLDENQISYFSSRVANRWLTIRLEFLGSIVVFAAAVFAVLGKDTMSPGVVGLSLSYALSITAILGGMVRMSGELENHIVSVERMKEYAKTPTEKEWKIEASKPPSAWPDKGIVTFHDYAARYREGLDLVLKGITLTAKAGEKIGIVGRTGAGKSSLTLALFRIIEPARGTIVIDGVDVSKIGLHDLRSKITIIPQDPALFSGTLRLNLDPFEQHSDQSIWTVLELSHLRTFVTSLPLGLLYEISEGGENLSVGQRQLVCLARALLRKTKILVLDEATAAVDVETDDLIQATIREEFMDCTILTIAHRLTTIMDYTRVLVLDNGVIRELDTPENLLRDTNSMFYGMAKDAGLM